MTVFATTHDTLCQGKLTLEQPVKGYRFGTDAMLLAASINPAAGENVIELGCGVGAALLVAAMRCPEARFTGIEREMVYAELARKNVETNRLSERVEIVEGDIGDKSLGISPGHHVIANPPYFEEAIHPKGNNDLRVVARHEEENGLEIWLKAANRLCRPKGTVTVIHRSEKMPEIISGLSKFCGEITIFPLWPKADMPAKRVIIRGRKGSNAPLLILPGLILHSNNMDSYTERADAIIRDGVSLWSDK